MRSLAKSNQNTNYILTVIDVFSKFAWAFPIKRKTGDEISSAFSELFKSRVPKNLQTDKGTEFINRQTQQLFKKHNINWFTTQNETKAQVVERFNRTLKDRMYRYFSAKNTKRWTNVLSPLLENYNSSYHRSIKTTPTEASKKKNQQQTYRNLYDKVPTETQTPKFKTGDYVRISKYRTKFSRGYEPNFTNEVFVVTDVLKTTPPTYNIAEIKHADKIIGTFYEEELSLFKPTSPSQI